jgi:hypothetical protein
MADSGHSIDDRWMDEYLEFGWAELISYLTKWAAFARWCITNNREEPS